MSQKDRHEEFIRKWLLRNEPKRMCFDYPLRPGFLAQVVLPRDMTSAEATRICAFIQTLAQTDREP